MYTLVPGYLFSYPSSCYHGALGKFYLTSVASDLKSCKIIIITPTSEECLEDEMS